MPPALQVSIDGLRSVPLDILKRLDSVPEAYLQELGEDHDLFAELPIAVQRQACLLCHMEYKWSCTAWHDTHGTGFEPWRGVRSPTLSVFGGCIQTEPAADVSLCV